ncbi:MULTISPECIES: TcpE family conjugal transfer membrane protein [Listeria]|uniref:TcpE family conjugal transfer membrane protein n=1 Tax=Listeria TaxID=1637 RepID=UPI000B5873A4|nr:MULTISPECIES: TcpE family conjugal transfer membrane protein [Listeria]
MLGRNYTEEFKYPIKFYKVGSGKWRFEFKEGLEMRKAVIIGVVFTSLSAIFLFSIVRGHWGIVHFFISNWLVMLVGFPAIFIWLIFGMKYDRKPVMAFFRDRLWFYRYKGKEWEHFQLVPIHQMNCPLYFEPFLRKKGVRRDG